jgi:hypothetical protein
VDLDAVLAVLFLAGIGEAIIEFLVSPILQKTVTVDDTRDIIYRTISCVLGVVLAVLFAVDALALVGVESGVPYVGCVVTGLLMGRGANWIHDFMSRWISSEKKN